MRRAAAPPAANDSTLADVIARYSAHVPSPQQPKPKPQPQPEPAPAPRELQSQQHRDQQQQQASAQAVEVRLMIAAAASANAPAGGLPAPPPAVHVSWNLPPRAAFAQHTAQQQPDSPSTITSPGDSWRERDARRSGDSSSSGEYPGRYVRSLPMLLSITPVVVADGPDVVSEYLDSMRRHLEGRDQQQSAEKAAGKPLSSRTASEDLQSSTESVVDPGAPMAGNGTTESSASEASSSRELRLQSLSSGSITAASYLCVLWATLVYDVNLPSCTSRTQTPIPRRAATPAGASAYAQCSLGQKLSHC